MAAGYAVHALDHEGHGASEGERGYVERFEHYVDDVVALGRGATASSSSSNAGPPVVLLAHSMGGLVALHVALRAAREPGSEPWFARLRGACVLAAALADEPAAVRAAVAALSCVVPRQQLVALPSQRLSRDAQVVQQYLNDPLVYTGAMRARWLHELFQASRRLQEAAHELQTPILLLHGTEDTIILPNLSASLFDKLSPHTRQDSSLRLKQGHFHELLNEPEREATTNEIIDWFDAKIAA